MYALLLGLSWTQESQHEKSAVNYPFTFNILITEPATRVCMVRVMT